MLSQKPTQVILLKQSKTRSNIIARARLIFVRNFFIWRIADEFSKEKNKDAKHEVPHHHKIHPEKDCFCVNWPSLFHSDKTGFHIGAST